METMWDDVDVDFGGDETGNFGPRMETGTALYQVDTTATISTRDGQVSIAPHVSAYATEDGVCIAANKHLSLFQDNCHKFLITMSFESVIDCLTCDEEGAFVVLGDRNGDLHFLDILTQQPLFSRKLSERALEGDKCFQHISFTPLTPDGICELCVVTTNRVFIFENIQLSLLHEALEEKNLQKAGALKSAIDMKVVDTSVIHTEVCLSAVLSGQDTLLTCGSGDNVLCLWKKDDEVNFQQMSAMPSYFTQGAGIKQGFLTNCGRLIITLDSQGYLCLWDVHSMTILRQWKDSVVSQFVVLESGEDLNNVKNVKLVLLTAPVGEHRQVVICELPRLTPVYTLQLSKNVHLAQCPTVQESILLIEGVDENESHSVGVSTLRVRSLTEAQPEIRFRRILHKKQFAEAESFAKLFNLDVELVYHVKANHLIEQLSPWNINQYTQDEIDTMFADLKSCLAEITDDTQVVQCCISAAPPTLQATLEILNLAKQRLTSESSSGTKRNESDTAARQALLTQVLEALHRLATFQVAFGAHRFSGDKWETFLKANMLKYFLNRLGLGQIAVAFSIWRQHQAEFEDDFDKNVLDQVLVAIPEQTASADLQPWLANDFIPYVIRIFPQGLRQVAAWLEQRVRNMEILEKTGWPQNALEMSELLSNTCMSVSQSNSERGMATPWEFATQTCNLSVGYSQILAAQRNEGASDAFVRLHTLSLQLKDLVSLHTKYNCCLSLAEYLQETTESLTYRMLDRVVAIELIPKSIETIVKPYMKEHNLREDRMLFQYIGDLAERSGKVVSVLGEAPWEVKAIAVIACIQHAEYKCRAILDAMKRAYVPWSTDMEALVQEGLALNHPRVGELKEQCRLIELRKMLTQYDLRHFNVLESSSAETLVYHILSQDRPTAVKDALEVVDAFAELSPFMAYTFRLRFLIRNNRLDEALSILYELSESQAHTCANRIITYTLALLGDHVVFDKEESEREKKYFTSAVCHVVRFLLKQEADAAGKEKLENLHEIMKNLYSLMLEFGEFVSYYGYKKNDFKKKLLTRYIQYFYTNQNSPQSNQATDLDRKPPRRTKWNIAQLYRLGELLMYPADTMKGQLATLAAEKGQVTVAIKIASELFDELPGQEAAVVMYQVALTLTQMIADENLPESCDVSQLPQTISEMANKALAWCPPDLLLSCLELSKTASKAYSVSRQCESGDYGASVTKITDSTSRQSGKRDPYIEWTFDPLFCEDGLVMDSEVALPAVYKYSAVCLVNDADWLQSESSVIQQISTAAQDVVQYLKENTQIELALAYSMDAMRACLINLTAQDMGFAVKNQKVTEALNLEKEKAASVFKAGMKTMQEFTVMLLLKLFQQSTVDSLLALGYLCNLPQQMALERLKKFTQSAGHNYKKVLDVSRVGSNLADLCKQSKVKAVCQELENNALWGYKLAKLKVSFKEAFNAPESEKKNLLPKIIQNEATDVNMIIEYCQAFNLDLDQALFLYIEHLLKPSKGRPSDDFVNNIKLCEQAIQYIYCADSLQEKLELILSQIDPYDFGRLSFVLAQLNSLNNTPVTDKGQQLLHYLALYKRVAPPSQYEVNYSLRTDEEQMMYGSHNLSPMSKERLPFHPFISGEPWKIITPELNEVTVEIWLHVARVLGLSQDQVYLTTIQNLIKAHNTAKIEAGQHSAETASQGALDKSQCNWSNDSVDLEFFDKLKSLLLKVNKCELAVACTGWVVKELPMGAEKVMALKASVFLTHKWMEACAQNSPEREKAKEAYVRFSEIFRRLSTEQVLFQHGLREDELISLANSPAKLIFKLYEHSSINKRVAGSRIMDKLPDIHTAVDEIAAINSTNKAKIQLMLMEQWLPSTQHTNMQDLDTTMNSTMNMTLNLGACLDSTMRTEEEISQDDINLRRVAYLLQQGNLENNALFLLNSAYTTHNTKMSPMCRVRALRCLFSLVDGPSITRLSQKSTDDIKEFLQTLLYLVEFERLHVTQSVQTFQSCNKEGLVKGIWRNHSHQHRAVRLVADICLDYGIYDVQLWNSLLQQLMAFHMMDYLSHVLVCVSGIPELWQVTCIQKVWKAVLLMPLTSAVPPLVSSQVGHCARSVKLLLRCPLLLDLDVLLFCRQLCRLELPELALSCVLLIPQVEVREQQMNALLENGGHVVVLQKITEWSNSGKQLPLAQQMLTYVYNYIECSGDYKSVEETPYMQELAMYLVNSNRITGLLMYAIKNNRLPQALQLLSLYIQTQPEMSFIERTHNMDHLQRLRVFCELNGILPEVEDYLPEEPEEATDDNDNSKQLLNMRQQLQA